MARPAVMNGQAGYVTDIGGRAVFVNAANLSKPPRHFCGNPQCATRHDGAAQLAAHYMRCGRCRDEWYCGAACQRLSWAAHKPLCFPPTDPASATAIKQKRAADESHAARALLNARPACSYPPHVSDLKELGYAYSAASRRDLHALPDDALEHVCAFLSVADLLSWELTSKSLRAAPDDVYRARLELRWPDVFHALNHTDTLADPYAAFDAQRTYAAAQADAAMTAQWLAARAALRAAEAAKRAHDQELQAALTASTAAPTAASTATAAAAAPKAAPPATASSSSSSSVLGVDQKSCASPFPAPKGSTWKRVYRDWWLGRITRRVQVFNRELTSELDSEYFMSCFNAFAAFQRPRQPPVPPTAYSPTAPLDWSFGLHESRADSAVAQAGDAFRVTYLPDHRGRISESVRRTRMRPNFAPHDPYKVYVDRALTADHIVVGKGIEVQWRQKEEHPFGWWFGEIAGFDPKTKKIRITFEQYYALSPWAVVQPTLGTAVPTANTTGQLGGVRVISDAEAQRWKTFLPAWKLM